MNNAIMIHKSGSEENKIECKTQEEVVHKVFEEAVRNVSVKVLESVKEFMEEMERSN